MNTTGDKADAGGNQPSRNTNNSNAVNPSSNLQSTGQSGNPSTAAGTSAYEAFIQQVRYSIFLDHQKDALS